MAKKRKRKRRSKTRYNQSISRGKRPFLKKEIELIIAHAIKEKNKTYALLFWLGLHCGLRISDLVRVKRVQLIQGRISIVAQKTNRLEVHVLEAPFYDGLDILGIDLKKLRSKPFRNTRDKNIISPKSARYFLRKYAKASGFDSFQLTRIGMHSIRKIFAIEYLNKLGNDEKALVTVSHKLHHINLQTTRFYLGIDDKTMRDGLNKLDFDIDIDV